MFPVIEHIVLIFVHWLSLSYVIFYQNFIILNNFVVWLQHLKMKTTVIITASLSLKVWGKGQGATWSAILTSHALGPVVHHRNLKILQRPGWHGTGLQKVVWSAGNTGWLIGPLVIVHVHLAGYAQVMWPWPPLHPGWCQGGLCICSLDG